ncbi:MAG: bifunctional glutamate N-acetyltransferase/amino-acid acetyltransferase ArgJ [Verrucomicrobiae bacterium]|nr:bifunctional glutamate N-acetyltransferase/amino-acid acetyltransferase ArgJ [Verrucomicrobiae bacterium]
MNANLKELEGSIVAPKGFKASGVFCDIKRLGTGKGSEKGQKNDLALIVSEKPCSVAGMFTTNKVCAAPVKLCIERIKEGIAQAIVANSGNANACTGEQGLKDACTMAEETAALLGLKKEHVLVASTGRIGVLMPMDNIKKGIKMASEQLSNSVSSADSAATAIMTSDTRPKKIAVQVNVDGSTITIGGICKGAGMIQPGMSPNGKNPPSMPGRLHATMLCFLTTDALIERESLQFALQEAVARSFNKITVDGDMSTNDTVLILANGMADNNPLNHKTRSKDGRSAFNAFYQALEHVCLSLAKMIVMDGEGVTKFVTIYVDGAKNDLHADAAARAVANSILVKTSWCGGDPNWGRIMDALGYSKAEIVEEKVDIGYSNPSNPQITWAVKNGSPLPVPFDELCKIVGKKEFNIHINLNLGKGKTYFYSSDLTEEYVDFNKGNISDPNSLGG